jgi:small subunit ribosomal protein S3
MGKKVSPHSIRIGITRGWDSIWFAKRGFKQKFLQDIKVRKFLEEKFQSAKVSKVEIKRDAKKAKVIIYTGKPGLIIGRGGEQIQELSKELSEKFNDKFDVSVQEIRKIDADASLIAQSIAEQISRRFPYRRVVKMAVDRAKESGVKGIKVIVSGRLNGVDIARKETYNYGKVPLHTLRANIDYATAKAQTTYGVIGIKVWVYHGLVFKNKKMDQYF